MSTLSCSRCTSAVFFSSRVTTAPFVRASAAVWRAAMAAEIVTSEGTTVGKEGLPVRAHDARAIVMGSSGG